MQSTALIAWKAWSKAFELPLWNPYGAAFTIMLLTLLVGYMLKTMLRRD